MSEAIDVQFQKALQYAIADICDESRRKNLTLADTVELAIMRGMKWQKEIDETTKEEPEEDKEWMYMQRNNYTVSEEDKYYHGYRAFDKN